MEHTATSFVRLVSNAPSSYLAFVLVYLLTIDLELKSVVDLTIIYQADQNRELIKKYEGSFIGQDGILYKLVGITNLFSFARSSNPAITFILVILLLGVFIWLAWWCFYPQTSLSFTAGDGDSKKKVSVQTKVASFILHYFEYFFILCITIFVQSITCFNVAMEGLEGSSKSSTLLTIPSQSNSSSATSVTSSSSIALTVGYTDLNTNITCKSVSHIYLVIFTSVLLLLTGVFKVVNHRLLTYRPNPELMLSKFGRADNMHSILIVGLLVLKTLFKSFPDQLTSSSTIYFGLACILGVIDLVVQTATHPYYSKVTNRFRYAESLLIALVSLHVVITLINDSVFARNEVYLIISCILCLIIILRVADNTKQLIEDKSLIERKTAIDNRKVLSFVHMGIKYINACLLNDHKVINSVEYQKIIFYFMTENQNDIKGDVKKKKWSLAQAYIERAKSNRNLESHQLLNPELEKSSKGGSKKNKSTEFAKGDPKNKNIEYAKPSLAEANKKLESTTSPDPELKFRVTRISKKPADATPSDLSRFTLDLKSKTAINNLDDNHGNRISINGVPVTNTMAKDLDNIEHSFTSPLQGIKNVAHRLEDMKNEALYIKADNIDRKDRGLGNSMSTISSQERSTVDASFVLFNSFSESKNYSVGLVVEMLDDMIEEHLHRLLNTPGVEFRTLFILLNTYVYFKLNYLGAAYQVSIKIREIEHRFSRINSGRLKIANKFSFKLLYAMIKFHIKNNLETGDLILPDMRTYMTFDQEQANTVKLYDVTQFINIYGEIKVLMKEMIQNKSKFLQSLMSKGADFKQISSQTNLFTKQKKKIKEFFKSMIKKSQGKFTPLMMIYGTYLFYIEQNIAEARKILRKFVAKKFFFDLRYISDISLARDEEMMTIGCSMEKDTFHQINMVSCNVFYQLEYDGFELIGQDLSILVPKPLSEYHKQLLMPHNMTGVLFEKKGLTETPVRKKNGYMTTCKASFRMNYRVNTCLEVFAVFVFDRENQNLKNLIVVDEAMMITEISEVCTDHFEKGTFIYQYNKKFYQIFEDLNYVSHFRLKHGSVELKELMKDNDILERYNTYFRFLEGENIEIKDKNGVRRFINIRIIVNYMASVQKFIRFVEYDILKEEDVKLTKIKTDLLDEENSEQLDLAFYDTEMTSDKKQTKFNHLKLDKAELKVKELIDYLNSSTLLQGASKTLATTLKEPSIVPGSQTSGASPKSNLKFTFKETKTPPKEKNIKEVKKKDNSMFLNTRLSVITDNQKERSLTLKDNSRRSFDSTAGAKLDQTQKTPLSSHNSNSAEPRPTDFRKDDVSDDESSRRQNQGAGVDKKKKGAKKGTEDSQRRRSTSYRKMANKDAKILTYMSILHEKIRTLKSNIMFIILIGYLMVSLFFQAFIGSEKYTIQQMVATDLMDHISAIDDITLALNYALRTVDFIDINRNVFRGVIQKDLLASYGISDIVANNSIADDLLKFKMHNSINAANIKMIEAAFKKVEYTDSFSFSPRVEGQLFNESRKAWQSLPITFKSLGSFLQPMIDNYVSRNLSEIMAKGAANNPEGDILEQTLRKNLGSEETKILNDLCKKASSYFMYVANFQKSFLLTSELLAICSILFVSVIVLLYAFLLRLKMKSVFLTVFQFRVSYES
jgi:hypothetical protein